MWITCSFTRFQERNRVLPGNEAVARIEVDADHVAVVLGNQPQQRLRLCGQISVRLKGDLHIVPLGDRQHAGQMIADDVEPLLVGPALGILVAVGRNDRVAPQHVGPNDGLVEHLDAVVAPNGPIGVDRDDFQAVFRRQIADQIGVVIDGDVGREAKSFEKVVARGRGQLDVLAAQFLDSGEALLNAPPLGTPVVGAIGQFQTHRLVLLRLS